MNRGGIAAFGHATLANPGQAHARTSPAAEANQQGEAQARSVFGLRRGIAGPGDVVLAVGCAAIAIPTLVRVALEGWTTEQGAHGPIVFVTGLWLLARSWPAARPFARPGNAFVVALGALLLPLYFLARVSGFVQIEGFLAYGLLLVAAYSRVGLPALRRMLFPLFYLVFVFPFPDTVVDGLTLPLKMLISQAAAATMDMFGYPVGRQGVMLLIGQYELLVAAACAGLNSLVSLSALSLLYINLRHGDRIGRALAFAALILPIALLANFVRVIILLLLTYHFGESAAQGFMHDFAGLVMFAVALLALGVADLGLQRLGRRRGGAAMVPSA